MAAVPLICLHLNESNNERNEYKFRSIKLCSIDDFFRAEIVGIDSLNFPFNSSETKENAHTFYFSREKRTKHLEISVVSRSTKLKIR